MGRAMSDHGLVGRDDELALLASALGAARAGTSQFVAIHGEPGIGKSSLLGALRELAESHECLVLSGRATEIERELPYGLLVDALDAYLEALDPKVLGRLAPDELDELASVFPALRSLGSRDARPTTVAERFRAHYAVRELLERLAARHPVVLALDDLHWSDGASLELVGHLLRRRPDAAVLVAATYRTGQAGARMAATVEAAERAGTLVRLELGAIDAEAAGRLTPGEDAAERERLYRESRGNPFYLLQLARRQGSGDTATPRTITAAIDAELEVLEPDELRFIQAAAVTGDPFDLDLAVEVSGLDEPRALEALDRLVARDLLRLDAVPRRLQFRHPLVRSAVYEGLTPGHRLVAHERAVGALSARGASPAALAHHVEQSARHGDAEALAVLRAAAAATAGRAPSSAARWYAAALRILPADAPPSERAALLRELARAQTATGEVEEAHDTLVETVELAAAGPTSAHVSASSALATVEQLLNRPADADRRLRAALAGLPDRDGRDGAGLMIDLAYGAFLRAEYDVMLTWCLEARDTARRAGERPLAATAAAITALGAASTGAVPVALEAFDETQALVAAMSGDELASRPHALQWLCAAAFYLDRYADGIAHAEAGLEAVRLSGKSQMFPGMTQAFGTLLVATGRLGEAAALLDSAVDAARLTDNALGLSWSLLNRSYAAVKAGDVRTANEAGEEAVSVTRGLDDGFVKARASAALGAARLEAGDAPAALALLTGPAGPDMRLIPASWRPTWLEVLVRCHLALGQPDRAGEIAGQALALADGHGLPCAIALAQRASAAVTLSRGEAPAAADLAERSAAGADTAGAPVEAAMARIVAGRALADAGDTEAAASQLEQAADTLERCGAPRHAAKAEHELRRLGRTIYRRTRPGDADAGGVASLTGRELEVARLVVDRRTNPQIAAELFLSIKTVETHMRNILRKLDADSRVEVARIVERAE